MSNVELANEVGLSPSPCLRRVRLLEESGVIDRYAALLNGQKIGLGLTVFVRVWFKTQDSDITHKFAETVRSFPEVMECYLTTGECDAIMRVVTDGPPCLLAVSGRLSGPDPERAERQDGRADGNDKTQLRTAFALIEHPSACSPFSRTSAMPSFVPDLSVILAFALASFVLAITPGPDMALFVSRTVNYGKAHGVAAVLGASTGLMVHTGLAAFGVSLLLIAAPMAFMALKIAGALYLIFLAVQAVRQGGGITLVASAKRRPRWRESYLTGVGINLTNPKVILFFVTFLPQFVSRADPAAPEKLVFLGGEFLVVSIPVVIVIVMVADWVAAVLTRSVRVQKALNWTFAAVFASFAAAILTIEARS